MVLGRCELYSLVLFMANRAGENKDFADVVQRMHFLVVCYKYLRRVTLFTNIWEILAHFWLCSANLWPGSKAAQQGSHSWKPTALTLSHILRVVPASCEPWRTYFSYNSRSSFIWTRICSLYPIYTYFFEMIYSSKTAKSILATIITLCVFHTANAFSNCILPASKMGIRHGSCSITKYAASSRVLHPSLLSFRMADSSGGGLSDDDISGLLSRVAQAKKRVEELPLLVFDAMLPKQRLGIQTANPVFRCAQLSWSLLSSSFPHSAHIVDDPLYPLKNRHYHISWKSFLFLESGRWQMLAIEACAECLASIPTRKRWCDMALRYVTWPSSTAAL